MTASMVKDEAALESLVARVADEFVCRYVADVAPGGFTERRDLLNVLQDATGRLEQLGMHKETVAAHNCYLSLWKRKRNVDGPVTSSARRQVKK